MTQFKKKIRYTTNVRKKRPRPSHRQLPRSGVMYIHSTSRSNLYHVADASTTFYISINPWACTECGDSLPFSGASSIPPCHALFPATPLRRPFFHLPSLHPAIYFLVYLLVLLFAESFTILVWESFFLPFSVHVQTNIIYAALLSLL